MEGGITTFLLGSAVALFIALLGWSEQIRAPHRESKELEKEFMGEKGITWLDLKEIIRASTPSKRIKAYMNLMKAGKMKQSDINKQIELLKNLHESKESLEEILINKYNLTIYLTISCFIFGVLSYVLPFNIPKITDKIPVINSDLLYLIIPFTLFLVICVKILQANKKEINFTNYIKNISDEM